MAVISGLIAGAAVAASAFGAVSSYKASKEKANLQRQDSALQAEIAAIEQQKYGVTSQASDVTAAFAQTQGQFNRDTIAQEQNAEAVRRQTMEVGARRQSTEILRQGQRIRALSLATATGQGAQFGSGLQGGYGQDAGRTNYNLLGTSQALGFGEQNFDINAAVSNLRLGFMTSQEQYAVTQTQFNKQYAALQSQQAGIQGQQAGLQGQMANVNAKAALGSSIGQFGGSLLGNAGSLNSMAQGFGGGGQMSYTDFGTGQGSWPMFGR